MLLHAQLPVNDCTHEDGSSIGVPYIDPIPESVPAPGEDGEPQPVSGLIFDCCIALAFLGALFAWWPILQAYRP